MKDQMTSYERMVAAIRFEQCDRIPVYPLNHYATTRVCNETIGRFGTDGEVMARCALAAMEYYDWDGIQLGSDVAVEGEACGSTVSIPEDAPAFMTVPVIQEYSDLKKLKVPDPDKAGRMPEILKAIRIVKEHVGNEKFIGCFLMGPMNIACQLRGIQNLMFDIMDEPDFFEEILGFANEVSLAYGRRMADCGCDMIMAGEALCSPNFIMPDAYREYVLPRQQKWTAELDAYGAPFNLIHICGNVMPILEDMGKTGTSCLDIDYPVDMKTARDVSGIACRGNINPEVLLNGTRDEVFCLAREICETTKDKTGIILGSGCDVSPDTPLENVLALTDAVKEFGWY